MTTETISLRVDATECAVIAARAERDKISLSDYIRMRQDVTRIHRPRGAPGSCS